MGMNAMDPNNANDIFTAFKDYIDTRTSGGGSGVKWTSYILDSDDWDENEYSLETDYPHSRYNIIGIVTAENATAEQRQAWAKADCGGYDSSNVITAHGTIPEIDIPVMLGLVDKDAEPGSTVATYNNTTETLIFGSGS